MIRSVRVLFLSCKSVFLSVGLSLFLPLSSLCIRGSMSTCLLLGLQRYDRSLPITKLFFALAVGQNTAINDPARYQILPKDIYTSLAAGRERIGLYKN